MSINLFAGNALAIMSARRLSPAQWQTLMILFVGHLAHDPQPFYPKTESRSHSAATSRMLRRLEDRGFVARIAAGPTRRRSAGVLLTVFGLRFMEAATGQSAAAIASEPTP
jgi:DNA-binding MarR family transcriptional regulator